MHMILTYWLFNIISLQMCVHPYLLYKFHVAKLLMKSSRYLNEFCERYLTKTNTMCSSSSFDQNPTFGIVLVSQNLTVVICTFILLQTTSV